MFSPRSRHCAGGGDVFIFFVGKFGFATILFVPTQRVSVGKTFATSIAKVTSSGAPDGCGPLGGSNFFLFFPRRFRFHIRIVGRN